MNEDWIIPANGGETKCQWSPYAGYAIKGQVRTVVIRGEEIFIDGKFINYPGFGKNLLLIDNTNAEKEFKKDPESIFFIFMMINNFYFLVQKLIEPKYKRLTPECEDSLNPMRTLTLAENFFYGKNLLSVTQFKSKYMVNQLLDIANRFHNDMDLGHSFDGMLKVFCIFYIILNTTHLFF